jgi:hypothetical protein
MKKMKKKSMFSEVLLHIYKILLFCIKLFLNFLMIS